MSNKLERFNEWRTNVIDHCNGRWETIAPKYCNNEAIHTILGDTNITCPNCGGSEKLFLGDIHTLRTHCVKVTCKHTNFDGIATIANLEGKTHTDIVKLIASGEGIDDVENPEFKGQRNNFKKPTKVENKPKPKTIPVQPKANPWATKERAYLLSNMSPVSDEHNLVFKYIENRGINTETIKNSIINTLYFVEKLDYYKKITEDDVVVDTEKGIYPAMVAKVLDCNFNLVGFHKTYLSSDGSKAKVSDPKQLAKALFKGQYSENGAIIPLCKPHNGRYGIAEGLETSLAILAMNRPCWSVLNANGITFFNPPKDCKILDVYGDLDASGAGQLVIIKKYNQLLEQRPEIKINLYLPPETHWNYEANPKGIDFLDSYRVNIKTMPALGGFTC